MCIKSRNAASMWSDLHSCYLSTGRRLTKKSNQHVAYVYAHSRRRRQLSNCAADTISTVHASIHGCWTTRRCALFVDEASLIMMNGWSLFHLIMCRMLSKKSKVVILSWSWIVWKREWRTVYPMCLRSCFVFSLLATHSPLWFARSESTSFLILLSMLTPKWGSFSRLLFVLPPFEMGKLEFPRSHISLIMKASSCLVVLICISIAAAYGPAFILSNKG